MKEELEGMPDSYYEKIKHVIPEENKNPEYVVDSTRLTVDGKDYWVQFEEIGDGDTHKLSMAYNDKEIFFFADKNYNLTHYEYKGDKFERLSVSRNK